MKSLGVLNLGANKKDGTAVSPLDIDIIGLGSANDDVQYSIERHAC